jgi:hypothetical protein
MASLLVALRTLDSDYNLYHQLSWVSQLADDRLWDFSASAVM